MSYEDDHVLVEVSLEGPSVLVTSIVPRSHAATVLWMHNFMAQHGMPAVSIRTVPAEHDDD